MSISSSDFEQKEQFRKFHRIISDEISKIKSLINQKEGFWFFETHCHSVESLLESSYHKKINAIVGTVAENVKNWAESDNISTELYTAYLEFIRGIDKQLDSLNDTISTRKQTGWEKFLIVLRKVGILILNRLPTYVVTYLTGHSVVINLLPSHDDNEKK